MAFKTLAQLRTTALNLELGITDDASVKAFGTTAERNFFLQRAFARLWPKVAKLSRETVTSVVNVQDYALTTLTDVERIEVMSQDVATQVGDRVKDFQVYDDESSDPPTHRLLIPRGMTGGLTLRLIGYSPYLIPAADGSACDLPARLEHVLIAGARAYAYRWKLGQFADFERFQNENRGNALTSADMVELQQRAEREFAQALADNARNLTGARTAMLKAGT